MLGATHFVVYEKFISYWGKKTPAVVKLRICELLLGRFQSIAIFIAYGNISKQILGFGHMAQLS